MAGVVAQHFFDGREFLSRVLPDFLMGNLLFLLGLTGSEF
jgi:hypothetical protein